MSELNILLSSAGRRPYLARWFRHGLADNGVVGRVVVADSDRHCAARVFADAFEIAPPVTDSGYTSWLSSVLDKHSIDLAISINDFELSQWSSLANSERIDSPFVVSLDQDTQRLVEDKTTTAQRLADCGLSSPTTTTARNLSPDGTDQSRKFVVKGRFGSGSKGLAFVTLAELDEGIRFARSEVTDRAGRLALNEEDASDLIVIQPHIEGQEYGLDVICDLNGEFVAILARRKIAMRAGETDKAITVDEAPFREVGVRVAKAVPHCGLIDVDVIMESNGRIWVIDINPRFGGGYPFSHAGGANIPAAYVAWTLGKRPSPQWLRSRPGVTSAKYVEIANISEME